MHHLRIVLDWRAWIPKGTSDIDIFFQYLILLRRYLSVGNRGEDNRHDLGLELEDFISLADGAIASSNQLHLVSEKNSL